MGGLVVVLILAALIGGVVWNHKNKEAAAAGVDFALRRSGPEVAAAVERAFCSGAKAKVKTMVFGVTVVPMGRGHYRLESKIGDSGTLQVTDQGGGSTHVHAHTDELYIGMPPKGQFKNGWLGVSARIMHRVYTLLGLAPNAAKMKRFQLNLENRLSRELGRGM
jgi:hypothetical protein